MSGVGITSLVRNTAPCKHLPLPGHILSSNLNFIRKRALEALTEALAKELDSSWNIKVAIPIPLHRRKLNANRLPFPSLGRSSQKLRRQTKTYPSPPCGDTDPELRILMAGEFQSDFFADGDLKKGSIVFEKGSQLRGPNIPRHRRVVDMAKEFDRCCDEIRDS